jgi:hypothetical protein
MIVAEIYGLIRLLIAHVSRPGKIRVLKQKRQLAIRRIKAQVDGKKAFREPAMLSPKPHGLDIDTVSESQRAEIENLAEIDDEIAALEAPRETRS